MRVKVILPWPDKGLSPNARRAWTESEIEFLRVAYTDADTSEDLDLDGLADRLQRTRYSVAMKASRLGLADVKRKGVRVRRDAPKYATKEDANAAIGMATAKRIAENGHPRGMYGKTHKPETIALISAASIRSASTRTDEENAASSLKALQTKVARYGSANPAKSRGSWKAGWREIGGKRNYYRSRWEANYARYLEWLKVLGEIKDWQHEPETFWFEAIKRGVRSYLPDFRVWETDGTSNLHEVKGWMDARSKTTLKRMAKYHPHETIIVIREKSYNSIARKVSRLIDGWEVSSRSNRL